MYLLFFSCQQTNVLLSTNTHMWPHSQPRWKVIQHQSFFAWRCNKSVCSLSQRGKKHPQTQNARILDSLQCGQKCLRQVARSSKKHWLSHVPRVSDAGKARALDHPSRQSLRPAWQSKISSGHPSRSWWQHLSGNAWRHHRVTRGGFGGKRKDERKEPKKTQRTKNTNGKTTN